MYSGGRIEEFNRKKGFRADELVKFPVWDKVIDDKGYIVNGLSSLILQRLLKLLTK